MATLEVSDTVPALKKAEALYISGGEDALATLASKVATGGHLMSEAERSYANDLCRWLRSLIDTERELAANSTVSPT